MGFTRVNHISEDTKFITPVQIEYTRAPSISELPEMPVLSKKAAYKPKEKLLWEQIQDEIKSLKDLIEKVPT